MRRSMKRVSGAAAVLAVAAALALCGPAAYAAPAAAGDTQPLPGEAQPAGGESGAQDEAAQAETAQADGGQAEAAQSDGATAVSLSYSAHVSNICVSSRGFEQKEHRKLSSLSIGSAHAF